jgi:serine O-acetyltransferase
MMELTLSRSQLSSYIHHLLQVHFPDGREVAVWPASSFSHALHRIEHCFSRIERKYYQREGRVLFDHLNADHMASLIYVLGNTIWRETCREDLPTRLYYLNKIMHGLDLFYSVQMPDIFLLVHPLGTVLGSATYGDYLVVYQNCTVGAVTDTYPTFGTGTVLYARSTVLGDSQVGDNVVFAANSLIRDVDIPSNTLVLGNYPKHRLVDNKKSVRERCFDAPFPPAGECG